MHDNLEHDHGIPHGTNPRYLAYCKAQGRSYQEQIDHDRVEYPGGGMVGFILWIGRQKRLFFAETPQAFAGPVADAPIWNQEAWDRFLGIGTKCNACNGISPEVKRGFIENK